MGMTDSDEKKVAALVGLATLTALPVLFVALSGCGAPPASTWSQAEEWVCQEGTSQGQQDGSGCLVYGTGIPEGSYSVIFDECYSVAYDYSFAKGQCGE